jgi:hypothetical protein
MIGKNAQIYADENGSLKNIKDVQQRLEKLTKNFVIESTSVDSETTLSQDDLESLTNSSLLNKIQEELIEKEAKDKFEYSPIPIYSTIKQVLDCISRNPKALLFCWLPTLLSGVLALLISPDINLNVSPNNSSLNSFTYRINASPLFSLALLILFAYGLKTITNLHEFFLSGGLKKNFSSYFLLSTQDVWFFVYSLIIGLRVAIAVCLIFLPIYLIMAWGKTIRIEIMGFLPVYLVVAFIASSFSLFLNARYTMALPAIIAKKKEWRTTWSFQKTKGNGWRIVLLVFLIPTLVETLFRLFPILEYGYVLGNISRIFYMTLGVGMFVGCFRHLTIKEYS